MTWVHGDATTVADLGASVDLAVMTGNVAQVFVADEDWHRTLSAVRSCLRPGGWFVFETRRPEVRDWETWDVASTTVTLPDGVSAVFSRTVTEVAPPLVTFESTTTIGGSASCARRRSCGSASAARSSGTWRTTGSRSSTSAGAPDRPGKELVFVSRRIEP